LALGVTQTLTEISIRDFSGGKGGQCAGLQSYHIHVLTVLKSGNLNLLEPSGPVQSLTGIALRYQLLIFPVTLYDCEMKSLDYRE